MPRKEVNKLSVSDKTKKLLILVIGMSLFLTIIFSVVGQGEKSALKTLKRSKTRSEKYSINAEIDNMQDINFDVEISPISYSKEESKKILNEVADGLDELIKGNNTSTDKVTENLLLPDEDANTGVNFTWYSSDYYICDDKGNISNDDIRENETKTMSLYCELKLADETLNKKIDIIVYPRSYTDSEKTAKMLKEEIKSADENARESEYVTLPSQVAGKSVTYTGDNEETSPISFMILGAVISFLLVWKEIYDRNERKKLRSDELTRDFPEFTSKLYLLCNGGYTVYSSCKKITKDYSISLEKGGDKKEAYEMLKNCIERIDKGNGEAKSYIRFGNDCNTKEYKKLASFLAEYVRKGTGDLNERIRELSEESFENIKRIAGVKGAKAGSKLIIPMVSMLFSIMLIIIVPAMRSFSF